MKLNLNWTLSVRQTVRQGMRGQHCLFAVFNCCCCYFALLLVRFYLLPCLLFTLTLSLSLHLLLAPTSNEMRAQVLASDVVVDIVILRFTCIFFR